MDPSDPLNGHVLILFDGVCNLCSRFVQFLIPRDPSARFRFASLQSAVGRMWLMRFGLDPDGLHSVIVIDNGKMYRRSDAVLRISGYLPGLWPAVKISRVIPGFIRDYLYDRVAASRYRWFGKKDACWLPDPDLKARFLE